MKDYRIAKDIVDELGLPVEHKDIFNYSITILRTSVLGYLAIVLVALILGTVKTSLFAAVTASSFRIFSGGAHSSSPDRCIAVGAIVFGVLGLLAQNIDFFEPGVYYGKIMIIAGLILCFYLIYRYAPADVPEKPIVSQRRFLRKCCFGWCVVWAVLVVFLEMLSLSKEIFMASTLGFYWQTFTLTPAGYSLINKFNKI